MTLDSTESIDNREAIYAEAITQAAEVIGQVQQKLEKGLLATGAIVAIAVAMQVFELVSSMGAILITGIALIGSITAIRIATKEQVKALALIKDLSIKLIRQEQFIIGVIDKGRVKALEEASKLKALAETLVEATELSRQIEEERKEEAKALVLFPLKGG